MSQPELATAPTAMPKVRRKPPPVHLVLVDTSVIWDKDKKHPVSPEFNAFWQQTAALMPLELCVPEVVLGELHFQQTTSALKLRSNIDEALAELSGITAAGYQHRIDESKVTEQVGAKLKKWLSDRAGTVAPTPIAKIDWARVIREAVWRRPPFTYDPKDKNTEKGFRDALILETVVATAEGGASAKRLVVFLCNDYLLRTTAEQRLAHNKHFLAFESTQDFAAYVHLTQQELTNEFVKGIQAHARSKFFTKSDPSCVVSRFEIITRLREAFAADLAVPTDSVPTGGGLLSLSLPPWASVRDKWWIGSTQFAKLVGEREFHWTSKVTFARLLEREASGMIGSVLSLRTLQLVTFEITWSANVKADGRFHDIQVLSTRKSDAKLDTATEPEVQRWVPEPREA